MASVKSKLNVHTVGRVCVTVADTDRAIDFYVDTLGFEKAVDVPMGRGMGWGGVGVAGPEPDIPRERPDGAPDPAALKAAGVDVANEASRYGDPVPPMFWLRDP